MDGPPQSQTSVLLKQCAIILTENSAQEFRLCWIIIAKCCLELICTNSVFAVYKIFHRHFHVSISCCTVFSFLAKYEEMKVLKQDSGMSHVKDRLTGIEYLLTTKFDKENKILKYLFLNTV